MCEARLVSGLARDLGLWWKGLSTWTEKGRLLKELDVEQVKEALLRYEDGSGEARECMRRSQMFLSAPKVFNDETIFHSIMPAFSSNFLIVPSYRPFSYSVIISPLFPLQQKDKILRRCLSPF